MILTKIVNISIIIYINNILINIKDLSEIISKLFNEFKRIFKN